MDDCERFSNVALVAPHAAATAAGRDVLIEGGTLLEAAIAAAAVSAVVVPDRNGLGGDALWLIRAPGPRGRVRVLDARGTVGGLGRPSFYRERRHEAVPLHGPEAVAAVPGTVAGWHEAHALSAAFGGRLPLSRLLAPAVAAARDGSALAARDIAALAAVPPALSAQPGFAAAFLDDGRVPAPGTRRRDAALAATLDYLVGAGLQDLYGGDVGRELSRDLEDLSSPLGRADLRGGEARWREPRGLELARHAVAGPPTSAWMRAAVAIGLRDGLTGAGFDMSRPEAFPRWHGLIEAIRAAETLVDGVEAEDGDLAALLDAARLARFALTLDRDRARQADPPSAPPLDEATVWIGAVDRDGAAVSLVQSLGGSFGSGVVSGRTGILMGNRAAALSVDPRLGPALRPGRRPPLRALPALLSSPRDGLVAALGTTGRPGAALMTQLADRVLRGGTAAETVAAPRFALGATPDGREAAVLVAAGREPVPVSRLRAAGHQIVDGGGIEIDRAGLVLRDGTGRVTASSDEGEVTGL